MPLMMLTNVDAGASDEEIGQFLTRYGFPPHDRLEHIDGDGSRPSVQLTYNAVDDAALHKLRDRIHGMFWKGHKLSVVVLHERFQ
ncbi:RNA-binding protein [Cupriavidus respiraculi]|uniref:RNA-binding protein n=1 Tax=Cupriavidus respiraculi TaxID=195930 RepID=UPI001C93CA69|nr:RNA-binding protein [Cupriavidus respiraculi]MBY4948021.1 RNA-binding protein [Cupriavidus respiraculi]